MRSKKFMSLSLALATLALAGLIGSLSFLTKTTHANVASVPEPPVTSCTAVTVTNIQSQSIALGGGEKITVDWTFASPGGDCVKVDKFQVYIEVTRRSGRKATRQIDASATARQVNAEFTDLADPIQSGKAVVTAVLSNAKGEKIQTGL
jgi:hypothetical protein